MPISIAPQKEEVAVATTSQYTCSTCSWNGDETQFTTKILSIIYRPKHNNIQAFKQIKCPNCNNLVTIIFETLDGSVATN